jgi:predicted CoA-binding protein
MQSDDDLRAVLTAARRIAVLGAHPDPARPAHYVPAYLHERGYQVLPVNPAYGGRSLWGEPVRATLAELDAPLDVIDVFRRPEQLAAHLDDVRAARPRLVWLQSGIRNDTFARTLEAAGIAVVQDRCLMVEHRRLIPWPSTPSS